MVGAGSVSAHVGGDHDDGGSNGLAIVGIVLGAACLGLGGLGSRTAVHAAGLTSAGARPDNIVATLWPAEAPGMITA